jgi:2-dehydropantoate 2-reductase
VFFLIFRVFVIVFISGGTMKIAVVGAGAMGSLFGGLLAESGVEVCLLDISDEHVRAINAGGLCIEQDGQERKVHVKASTTVQGLHEAGLVILFVKSMHTLKAARTAKNLLGATGYVLTLQNGMGNVDQIAEVVAPSKIIAGTTSHGATFLGPGKIRHAGKGPTTMGFWYEGDPAIIKKVAELFKGAGIQTTVSENIRDVVWDKLLVNVGINAITALTGIKNGQLLDLPATKSLSREAVEEAVSLAKAKGISVRDQVVEHVFNVATMTANNRSSMGQDVDHRRSTEIDAINGFVVRESEKLGIDAPVNRTLTGLIETLQHHYEKG